MIILDDSEDPTKIGPTSTTSQQQSLLHDHAPPPAYGAITSDPEPPPPSGHGENDSKQSTFGRFFKAFCVALVIMTIFSTIWRIWLRSASSDENYFLRDSDFPTLDGLSSNCVRGNQWFIGPVAIHSRELGFLRVTKYYDLPVDSEELKIISRGDLSSGSIEITSSVDVDVVRLEVSLPYHHIEFLDRARVCVGQNGLGLFTPEWWRGKRDSETSPKFSVKVIFPADSRAIKSFRTDLPNYTHYVDTAGVYFENLVFKGDNTAITGDTVHFGRGVIETSDNAISFKNLHSNEATLITTNSPVEGYFNVTNSLSISTSNAPIKVQVDLGKGSASSALVLKTVNSAISADSKLFSNIGFMRVKSTNAPIKFRVLEAPLESELKMKLQTTNSPVDIYVPSTFEGWFSLNAAHLYPAVIITLADDQVDPTGQNRGRALRKRYVTRQLVTGNIFWDEKNADRGMLEVETTRSRINLLV